MKKNKKKILVVINTMGRAGAETALIGFLKQFSPKDYQVDLVSIINRGEMFDEVPDYVRIRNHNPDTRSVLDTSGKLCIIGRIAKSVLYKDNLLYFPAEFIKNFWKQYKEGNIMWDKLFWRLLSDGVPELSVSYDLAVAYLEGAATYYVADHVHAAKKCAFVHTDYYISGYRRYLDKDCYDKMDKIFVVSEDVKRSVCEMYPEHANKVKTFRNILDVGEIRRKAELKGGFTDSFKGVRLLTIGRLHYRKAYDAAIETMKLLKERGENVKWYVLGEGAEREKLEQLIEKAGLQKHFILVGAVDNPYPYLKQCDIYVHATRIEGKSIAIEEAQILGKPIVASRTTGAEEQIMNGENGLLVQLNPKEVAASIHDMIHNEQLRNHCIEKVQRMKFTHPEDMELLLEMLRDSDERNNDFNTSL